MAARESMENIIGFVRELIFDTNPSSPHYTDEQIQIRLDLARLDFYNERLQAVDVITSDGQYETHDFYHKLPMWESNAVLQYINGPIATPDTPEPMLGKWSFTADQTEDIMITGRAYNVYKVAANLLTSWSAELRDSISSWTADGTTIQRANQVKNMMDLSDRYNSMAWGWGGQTQIKLVRRDVRG